MELSTAILPLQTHWTHSLKLLGNALASPYYIEALTAAIQADDLFFAGLHQEMAALIYSLWESFPTGSNIWGPIMREAGKHREKDAPSTPQNGGGHEQV
jgi:hypothetical protein